MSKKVGQEITPINFSKSYPFLNACVDITVLGGLFYFIILVAYITT